ncbi:LHFPL tetraspan subfamily member 3 protein-like [Bombina bombina]|uniref:LHFPL tetraspan subfamily member 3 protein-like n=1 Tax=Bombina bombina TaxID=8345 RepID=UPI00235A4AA2|nr:LHFPL tetraspan subfamily member 3 protein-like [Bombina bombina]
METPAHASLYNTDFVQNGRAITALWGSCTLFLGVLEFVVLLQPAWILGGEGKGQFGLYEVCEESEWGPECRGPSEPLQALPPFQAAAGFIVCALLLVLLSLGCLALLWFCHSGTVFKLCAWLQLSAASCQALGCLLFPDGWDSPAIRPLCGYRSDRYQLGGCSVHWAFILAILGIFDALVLSILGFTLGKRQDALQPDEAHLKPNKKGEQDPFF